MLELLPAPHPDRSSPLNNLANALRTRFDQSGQREDLDEAISFHREVLELLPALHHIRSCSLNNVATALRARFEQSGQRKDLDEAISFHREALELRRAPHPRRSGSPYSLANALRIDSTSQVATRGPGRGDFISTGEMPRVTPCTPS